ncbi:MAG: beta-ketoacyl-ACP synthase III [Tumebacillaceae bacterium]
MWQALISGTGSYVPENVLSNKDLEQMMDTSDEWIIARTGISERRIASPDQATSDLAFEAAKIALADAGITAEELDMIIVCTCTPDYKFPSVACQLQHLLGCRAISAFDVQAVCSGFLTGLQVAESFIKSGRFRHVLVVGADTFSRITDYTDRSTGILFSDGAGAVVVSQGSELGDIRESAGILHSALHAQGEHWEMLHVPGGGSRHPQPTAEHPGTIIMDGRRVFKLAVTAMSESVQQTLEATGYEAHELNWLIPHQANARIMQAIAEQFEFPIEKVINNIRDYGNNSAATIPLALDLAVKRGQVQRGDLLMMTAFGGGLVWGSLLLRF